MKRCLIIGGGFAGLSSAVFLAEKGFQITLLEASPKLGGRAYALYEPKYDDYFDNGQHILMGCYKTTLELLNKINALSDFNFPEILKVNFVDSNGRIFQLKTVPSIYPINLILGFFGYRAISRRARLNIIKLLIKNFFTRLDSLENYTVEEWLRVNKQSNESIKNFWEIIAIATLNTKINKASAHIFVNAIKKMFNSGHKSYLLIIPHYDLNNFYVNKAKEFIEKFGGKILTSQKVVKLVAEGNKIIKVITNNTVFNEYDYIISCIPEYSLRKIKIENSYYKDFSFIPEFKYSPILNVHLWLKENPFNERFYGLLDSSIHWLFNHGKHISLTTSAAEELIKQSDKEILSLFYSNLERYFPIFKSEFVIDYKIIKEKRATFIPDKDFVKQRKEIFSPFENLFLAGDWTNTELPSTIESAVFSAYKIAKEIINTSKL
ncbi:MAG: hydroxysqualene dehydroxylase HpnE [Melioribacter sp.]|nr:hydroxysqualene dehydroxylase HpnE [Melioribacter sp.]